MCASFKSATLRYAFNNDTTLAVTKTNIIAKDSLQSTESYAKDLMTSSKYLLTPSNLYSEVLPAVDIAAFLEQLKTEKDPYSVGVEVFWENEFGASVTFHIQLVKHVSNEFTGDLLKIKVLELYDYPGGASETFFIKKEDVKFTAAEGRFGLSLKFIAEIDLSLNKNI